MSQEKITVSIIIPAYNAETWIRRSIESVLRQDYPDKEIVVVDDGSTDSTAVAVNAYKDQVRYIRQENKGPGAARNAGASHARGEYLMFLDADDEYLPGIVKKMVEGFDAFPDADAGMFGCQQYNSGKAVLAHTFEEDHITAVDDFFRIKMKYGVPCTDSFICRKDVFFEIGGYPTAINRGEDKKFFVCLGGRYKWFFVPEYSAICYSSPMTTTTQNSPIDPYVRIDSLILSREEIKSLIRPELRKSFVKYQQVLVRSTIGASQFYIDNYYRFYKALRKRTRLSVANTLYFLSIWARNVLRKKIMHVSIESVPEVNRVAHKCNCTIVVSSCDKYEDTWYPFFKIMKAEWPDRPYPIVLITDSKSFNYEDMDIRTLHIYEPGERIPWGKLVKKSLKRIDTEYVIFLLENFFLQGKVDQKRIEQCINWMDDNKDISVFYFRETYSTLIRDDKYPNFEKIDRKGRYRFNCQAALWRREKLIRYIRSHESPWEWENLGSIRSSRYRDDFYSAIEGEPHVFEYEFPDGGIYGGKWSLGVKELFEKHEINIDFSKRGFAKKWTGARKQSTLSEKISKYFIVACKSLDIGILSHIRWYRTIFKQHKEAKKAEVSNI